MKILDYAFGEFKWYRRLRGGAWLLIGPGPSQPALGWFWVKGQPYFNERVYAVEDYS
jgi:hypothetical protein